MIFFNCVSVMDIIVPQFQVKDTHITGVVMITQRKMSLGFREKMFPLFMFPFSEWHMAHTIQWDFFLSVNGYLDFINPLQLQDLPRVTAIAIILLMASKTFLKERERA